MKKKKLITIAVALLITLNLQGCSSKSKCKPSDKSYYCIEQAVKKGLGK